MPHNVPPHGQRVSAPMRRSNGLVGNCAMAVGRTPFADRAMTITWARGLGIKSQCPPHTGIDTTCLEFRHKIWRSFVSGTFVPGTFVSGAFVSVTFAPGAFDTDQLYWGACLGNMCLGNIWHRSLASTKLASGTSVAGTFDTYHLSRAHCLLNIRIVQ